MPRVIFIGDLHGCIDEFQELVAKVQIRPGDRVICLGDFMDKGPEPAACVRFARESGFQSIIGNHEQKHLKWRRNEARAASDPKYKNRMKPFLPPQLAQNAALSQADVEWLSALPVYLEPIPGFVAVHGGLLPGLPLEEQPADKIVRLRYLNDEGKHIPIDYDSPTPVSEGARLWPSLWDGPYNVVYGHEAHSLSSVQIDFCQSGVFCYGIDTGCVHGGRLTAMIVEDGQVSFVQVQARRKYAESNYPIPE